MAKKEQLIVVLKQVTPIAGGGTGNCRGMGMRSEFAVCQSQCLIFRSTDLGSASIEFIYVYIYNIYIYMMYIERYIFCSPVTSLFRIVYPWFTKGRWFFVFATSSFRRWPDFKGIVCQQEVAEEKENTLRVKARRSCSALR